MIPDDEPWWMVRQLQGMQGDGSVAAAGSPAKELSPGIGADETEEPTDFRPFGYEW